MSLCNQHILNISISYYPITSLFISANLSNTYIMFSISFISLYDPHFSTSRIPLWYSTFSYSYIYTVGCGCFFFFWGRSFTVTLHKSVTHETSASLELFSISNATLTAVGLVPFFACWIASPNSISLHCLHGPSVWFHWIQAILTLRKLLILQFLMTVSRIPYILRFPTSIFSLYTCSFSS